MDVELPSVSIRKCVKAGKDVSFHEAGGVMRDRVTGKKVQIYEMDGTYYMKLNVHLPENQKLLLHPEPVQRPGR